MKLRKTEKTLTTAAAKAGMDEKTARKWLRSGKLPSQSKGERKWRTRCEPFQEVEEEIEGILKRAPTLQAKTLFEYLCRKYPGRFQEGQLRTLQRLVKVWRARHGKGKEVMFPQQHRPGEQAQSDFTHMGSVGVRIAGEPFEHLLYHFVLTYSNWEAATICFAESFESLCEGLQNALWEVGAVPREHRTDSLTTPVKKIKKPGAFRRYRWREELFPGLLFRVAYDELRRDCPQTAERLYLKILWWAAKISEERVQRALEQLVKTGERIRAERVKEVLDQSQPAPDIRQLRMDPVQLSDYDGLLSSGREVRA